LNIRRQIRSAQTATTVMDRPRRNSPGASRSQGITRRNLQRNRSPIQVTRAPTQIQSQTIQRQAPRTETYDQRYERHYQEALNILLKSPRMPRFGDAWREKNYDLTQWETLTHKKNEWLVLRSGIKPSQGIDELFKKIDNWKYDCAEMITLARYYAIRHAIGADAFNRGFLQQYEDGLETKLRRIRLNFHKHWGQGLASHFQFSRENPGEKFRQLDSQNRKYDVAKEVNTSVEKLLDDAPLLSRVMWRNHNSAVPDSSPFKRENAVLVKKGGSRTAHEYASHPFGFVKEKGIVDGLKRSAEKLKDYKYQPGEIFIQQIEIYDRKFQK
jgi:hypothetical protein